MPCLTSLAPELVQQIGSELGKDLATLRLASKHLSLVLEPQIFRSIAIYILRDRLEPGLSLLKTLALSAGSHRAATATHNLRIVALCPLSSCASGAPAYHLDSERGLWVPDEVPEAPVEAKLAEEQMKELLQPAIASLKNLRSIRWSICSNDLKWAQSAVMEAVKTLKNLESFRLDLAGFITDVQFDSLRNLRKIAITGYCHNFISTIVEPLIVAIENSPHLASLEFGPGYPTPGVTLPSLHQLLKHHALESSIHLKCLNLKGCRMRLDRTTLPHLRHLTSLTLADILVDTAPIPDDDPIKAESSTHDEIWLALNKSGILLQNVSVDNVGSSFLNYISSYTGLKKLHLIPRNFLKGLESDIFAARFYEQCLLHHLESLEELDIESPYEGRWCLINCNLATLSQCPRLRVLKGGIILDILESDDTSDMSESDDGISGTPERDDLNPVKILIDNVASGIPSLEELGIRAANCEGFRGARCGNVRRGYLDMVSARLAESVIAYRSSASVTRLPLLQAGSHPAQMEHYFAKPSEDACGTLAYQCDMRVSKRQYPK